jgi:CDP-diacylglycerol--glycerol-3-phosphate 3-phosphatidyltransferase
MTNTTTSASDWRHRVIRPVVEQAARLLSGLHISANALTVAGFLIVAASVPLIIARQMAWSGFVILVGSILDSFDGALARFNGQVSSFGAMLDSILDRLSEGMVLVALVYIFAKDNNPLGAVLSAFTLLISISVSYVRARAEGLGISCTEGWFTRVERVIVIVLGFLTGYVIIALVIVSSLSLLTLLQRLFVVWSKAR